MSKKPHFVGKKKPKGVFERIMKNFHQILKDDPYGGSKNDIYDPLYRYGEIPLLSLFAGAIWRTGKSSHALQEFCGEKKNHAGKTTGRHDLWFHVSGKDYWVEAKHRFLDLTKAVNRKDDGAKDKKEFKTRFDKLFRDCREDMKSIIDNNIIKHENCYGMIFIVPYFDFKTSNKNKGHLDKCMQLLKQELIPYAKKARIQVEKSNKKKKCDFVQQPEFIYIYRSDSSISQKIEWTISRRERSLCLPGLVVIVFTLPNKAGKGK